MTIGNMCGGCDRFVQDRTASKAPAGFCHYHPPMLAIDTEGVVRQLRARVDSDDMACASGFLPRART